MTLVRRPTSTSGSEVAKSRSCNEGATAPTRADSYPGVPLILSQIAPKSAAAVTAIIMAVTGSGRRRRAGAFG